VGCPACAATGGDPPPADDRPERPERPDIGRRAADEETVWVCARCSTEYTDSDACPACGELRVPVPCEDHPERMAEGRCVICGRAVCDDCRAEDRNACLCLDHRTVPIIQGWAQVYSTASELEARLLRENLQAEGIDAQVYSQKDRSFTVDLGELSIVRLLVPVPEYRVAFDLIRQHMDTDGEVVFACPECGEPYEPGARECAACGATLG
jgi:rubrerythrin